MKPAVTVGIESEGPRVVIAVRDEEGHRATLNLARKGAGPLAATVALVASDEGPSECEFALQNATLETDEQ